MLVRARWAEPQAVPRTIRPQMRGNTRVNIRQTEDAGRLGGRMKYGIVAFSLCLVELFGIWLPFAVVLQHPTASLPWLLKVFAIVYLAGLVSIPVAIVGLFRDKPRWLALLALIFGIVNIFLCVVPVIL